MFLFPSKIKFAFILLFCFFVCKTNAMQKPSDDLLIDLANKYFNSSNQSLENLILYGVSKTTYDLQYQISKKIMLENPAFFYPKVNLFPGCTTRFEHKDQINYAIFSPEGKQVLTASNDGTAKLWDLDGNLIQIFQHNKPVNMAIFSPNGQYVLTASDDKSVRLWDLNGKTLKSFEHYYPVEFIRFSSDGKLMLTLNLTQNTLNIWNLDQPDSTSIRYHETILSSNFSPNNTLMTILKNKSEELFLNFFNPNRKQCYSINITSTETAIFAEISNIGNLRLVKNNGRMFSVNARGDILANFNAKDFYSHGTIIAQSNSLYFAFALPGKANSKISLINCVGNLIKSFEIEGEISSITFSPDEKYLLTTFTNNTTKLLMIHPLWNSKKYRQGSFNLSEISLINLILTDSKYFKSRFNSDASFRAITSMILECIDGEVPYQEKFIKTFLLHQICS